MQKRSFLQATAALALVGSLGMAHAQTTPLKFQLDWRFEGPAAFFLLPVAKGFDLVWRLVDADSGTLLALGKIGVVCVDPHSKRPCALPEALRQRLQQLQPLLAEA